MRGFGKEVELDGKHHVRIAHLALPASAVGYIALSEPLHAVGGMVVDVGCVEIIMVEPEPDADPEAPMLVHHKSVAQFISRQVELPFQIICTTAYGRVDTSVPFQHTVAPVRPPCHQFVEQPVVKLVVAVLYHGLRVDIDGVCIHTPILYILHGHLLVAGTDCDAIALGCWKHGECPPGVKEKVVGMLLRIAGIDGHPHTVHRVSHYGHMATRRYPYAVYPLHLLVQDAHRHLLSRHCARDQQAYRCQKNSLHDFFLFQIIAV